MTEKKLMERDRHLRANVLAWLALRHFLTADLLRQLSAIIVSEVAGETMNLESLFEERVVCDLAPGLASWIVKPRDTEGAPLASYLQERIRLLVWQNDEDIPVGNIAGPFGNLTPNLIESAIKLSKIDLATARRLLEVEFPAGHSVVSMIKCFQALESQKPQSYAASVGNICQTLEMPLSVLMIKHFGDICADADEWQASIDLYRMARHQLGTFSSSEWDSYIALLEQLIAQSVAAATRVLAGPREAASLLLNGPRGTNIQESPLLSLNAAQDELQALSLDEQGVMDWRDRRASILLPPLLLQTQGIEPALESWLAKNYDRANRYFWQILRRQIALGSASETRLTKAYYAASLLDELTAYEDRHLLPDSFWLVVRLLVESGQPQSAERAAWSESTVQTYVDEHLVGRLLEHAIRQPGARLERLTVAVELAYRWLEIMSPEKVNVAKILLKFVADTARAWPASAFDPTNLGGRCLKILGSLARTRPEFRELASSEVIAAVVTKLSDEGWWTGKSDALKVVSAYLDTLTHSELKALIDTVLDLLERLDPTRGFWPVVQPAIDFLASSEARVFVSDDQGVQKRIFAAVLRFGIQQETEHARLLYHLQSFDLAQVPDRAMYDALRKVVEDVKEHATEINASNAAQNIGALLVAPSLAGKAGIETALDALTEILRSAFDKQPSISFAHAYEPLRILAIQMTQITADAGMTASEMRSRLVSLLDLVKAVWERSQAEPSLFASFSIPPSTRPNTVVVHNWAFASIVFADALEDRTGMLASLEKAAMSNASLKEGIDLALATFQSTQSDAPGKLDSSRIRSEGRDAFYRALGSRLVSLQGLLEAQADQRRDLIQALLDQCLKLGPQQIDAAVFVLACEDGSLQISNLDYSNYEKRLAQTRDLRVMLIPTLINLSKRTSKR